MDKLIEKFKGYVDSSDGDRYDQSYSEEVELGNANACANITKEVACGFAEWTKLKGWKLSGTKWFKEFSSDHGYTTSELFDLYIKSL